jgi:hypothetical protein
MPQPRHVVLFHAPFPKNSTAFGTLQGAHHKLSAADTCSKKAHIIKRTLKRLTKR